MVNYYEELGLDRSMSLDEINRVLSRIESVWKTRRTRAPEAATRKLALILDAREVFRTQDSRDTYDAELEGGEPEKTTPDPVQTDWWELAFEAWHAQDWRTALSYAESGLREDPSNMRLWQIKAYTLQRMGDMAGALVAARQRVMRDRDNADAHADLAQTLVRIASPNFEYDSSREREMREACEEYQQAVRIDGNRYATDVAQCYAYLCEWNHVLTWSLRGLEYNRYDEHANMYYTVGLADDAESKLSGGTTITNSKQLAYVKAAIKRISNLELSTCGESTLAVIQEQMDSLQGLVDEAEHVEWRGFRYGQMSGYEYAARTLPQALVRTGLQ